MKKLKNAERHTLYKEEFKWKNGFLYKSLCEEKR